ncbi:MAG: NTP transferase domain-containing protein [Pseudomonadota bacterium]
MKLAAIVLAGQRRGQVNPIAAEHGVPLKCVAPIDGRPLIAHVLETLSAHPAIDRIVICVEPESEPLVKAAIGDIDAVFAPAQAALTDSVYAAAGVAGAGPYFITTADNVLLEAPVIDQVIMTLSSGAGALLTLARKDDVMTAHPDGQRNYYAFSDDSYANCNSYAIASLDVIDSAEVFREGGQFMKNPGRIARAFGLLNLIRLRFGWISLHQAMRNISKRLGVDLRPVVLGNGEYAIDVDNARTYRVCEEILKRRQNERVTV